MLKYKEVMTPAQVTEWVNEHKGEYTILTVVYKSGPVSYPYIIFYFDTE